MSQSVAPSSSQSHNSSELTQLVVWKRLDVGPVRVEARRLIAPYKLTDQQGEAQTELIYRYEEDVWTPGDPSAENLAQLIASQVALNYGLFCEEIVFHGRYDATDRRFLEEMCENTAREIYINKLCKPNPFLRPGVAPTQSISTTRYCQAVLHFSDDGVPTPHDWQWWNTQPERHLVLSSGGKDSLASYGLLREIGVDVHPIFVNESGRHWFTALNAYQHSQQHDPNTARVWTNADRVFNWFLRQNPLIREDFAKLRADIYPLRLWTVAVFLFGVLPLARKRKLGRLVIGNEYDTTITAEHEGISHFEGSYDQSQMFDDRVSRYFLEKGWGVSQFSILRPLSELLIETVLARRYPDLLAQQVSCHAAHKEKELQRFAPCGTCEKCRRIVAMLTALEISPTICGYSPNQIEQALQALQRNPTLKSDAAGLEHLLWMLSQKPERSGWDFPQAQQHSEVMQLRFHPQNAPVDGIPVSLRRPLYRLMLEHAQGAVFANNERWSPFSVLEAPEIFLPYAFEVGEETQQPRTTHSPSQISAMSLQWGELTWPQAEAAFAQIDVAILPVGAIEQHGPHLPLDTDAFDADYLAKRVALACSTPRPLVMPLVPYGVSYHHNDFKGTLSVTNEAMASFIYDIGMSVARNGIQKLIILNGHGGNDATLNHAAQMINRDARIFVCVDTGSTSDVDLDRLSITHNDVHAGEIETSTTLAVRPHLVDMSKAESSIPSFHNRYLNFTSQRNVSWHAYTERISASGVMGDPTQANLNKGRHMWEIMIAHLVAFIEELKQHPLPTIYQRRY